MATTANAPLPETEADEAKPEATPGGKGFAVALGSVGLAVGGVVGDGPPVVGGGGGANEG